jgi:hypothetical protein
VALLLNRCFGIQVYNVYFPPSKLADGPKGAERLIQEPLPAELGELIRSPESYFIKTHDLPPDDAPAIYVARDGRDALVSYAWYALTEHGTAAPKDPGRYRVTLRDLIQDQVTFGGWSGNVKAWLSRAAPTLVLKYEEILRDPKSAVAVLRPAVGAAARRAPRGPLEFDALHREMPWFFRKGKAGAWREEMPDDAEDLFWTLHGDAMERLGYPRETQPDEIRTGRGWHAREQYGGETFRWVDNDAELIVPQGTGRYQGFWVEVEPGPGLGGEPLRLRVVDQTGEELARPDPVPGRSRLEFRLPAPAAGPRVYRLSAVGGGWRLPSDRRTLNFRVFGYGWLDTAGPELSAPAAAAQKDSRHEGPPL